MIKLIRNIPNNDDFPHLGDYDLRNLSAAESIRQRWTYPPIFTPRTYYAANRFHQFFRWTNSTDSQTEAEIVVRGLGGQNSVDCLQVDGGSDRILCGSDLTRLIFDGKFGGFATKSAGYSPNASNRSVNFSSTCSYLYDA